MPTSATLYAQYRCTESEEGLEKKRGTAFTAGALSVFSVLALIFTLQYSEKKLIDGNREWDANTVCTTDYTLFFKFDKT
jgi:hypothetical protein